MYQYRQIIVRLRLGETDRSIAKSGLAGRQKVKEIRELADSQGWLEREISLPEDEVLLNFFVCQRKPSASTASLILPYKDQVTQWHDQGIQASTIHNALVRNHGFTGSYDAVRRFVRKLKSHSVDVTIPLDFKPGECAQVDFGSGPKLLCGNANTFVPTWIFVMVLAWSRHTYAEIVYNQRVETWLACHRHAFEWFNGVISKVVIDNPKCAITKACYYDPIVQRAYEEFAQGYGFIISPCPPREPKKKGRVESGVKYVKRNFVPLREFRDIVDANQQLHHWLLETAGNRIHGSTHEKPLNRFAIESSFLKTLPDNPPDLAVWSKVKVHGDCHVQFGKCRYSVPYRLIKHLLWLRASETTVRIYDEHVMVALHVRLTVPGSRHTLPEHLPPHAIAFVMRDPQWCLKQSVIIGQCCTQVIQRLFDSHVLDNLRAAQGILGLQKTYGSARLESACQRALTFESFSYHTIKSILKKGLDYEKLAVESVFDTLASTYTGNAYYGRDTRTLLQ